MGQHAGLTGRRSWRRYLLVLCFSLQLATTVVLAQTPSPPPPSTGQTPNPPPPPPTGQTPNSPPPPPPPTAQNPNPPTTPTALVSAEDSCVGVFLKYEAVGQPKKIRPFVDEQSEQPYSFESTVTITNYGYEEVTNWEMSIDFQFGEVIAEAPGVMFLDLLAPPGLKVGNDTRIIGSDQPRLLTSIATAENQDLISTNFSLVGTEFGVSETEIPLPANMRLVNDGYKCGDPSFNANSSGVSSQMWVCCTENATEINSTNSGEASFLERETGDVTMTYDIVGAYTGSYWAQVSILMDDPMGRINNWNLTWQWTQGEFIQDMIGAQILGPNDQDKCVYGRAAEQYANDATVSFETVMSCSPNPVIVDLTADKRNDSEVGMPYCCRNGSLLPDLIDPSQSKSNFRLHVRKLTPHMAQNDISPPLSWKIAEGYNCSQPRQVSPTEFDPEALHSASAVASWQVVCNKIVLPVKTCCVSFSAYYNDSIIPCPTCSCGCSSNTLPWNGDTCNPNIDPMFLPSTALLLPPSNRTAQAIQLARLDHYQTPTPIPCPDNCGVAINWHVYSDYTNGWSARITLFNWDNTPIPTWSAAIEMPKAMPGFQDVYSFNGSKVPDVNNTLFMHGRDDYENDYLIAKDAKDNPGKLQSILSFDKRKTLGIDVVNGDGYPSKVWFNGEECAIPKMYPTGDGWRLLPTFQIAVVMIATIFLAW